MRRECPARRCIVDELRRRPGVGSEGLASNLRIPIRTVRYHLRALRDAGVVRVGITMQDGRSRFYYLNEKRLRGQA